MGEAAAFGFRWNGIEGPRPGGDEVAGWPSVAVRPRQRALPAHTDQVTADEARLRAAGGSIGLCRMPREATLDLPRPAVDAEVLRLHVARMAAVFSTWEGRTSLQAGAVTDGTRAVAVAGATHAGKTTLLDAFARAGGKLLCDELVSLDEGRVFAGTPLLNVRPGAAARGGDPAPPEASPVAAAPLAAIVFLDWGARAELVPLRPAERLAGVVGSRVAGARTEPPPDVLDLARLPAWRLVRPRSWAALEDSVRLLSEALASL